MPTTINGSTGIDKVAAGAVERGDLPAGTVLQVVSATKTDTASVSTSTFTDIAGLSLSITPTSATSKILVFGTVYLAWQNAVTKAAARLMRDSTPIAIGDAAGSRARVSGVAYVQVENYAPFASSVSYLDSPNTTSAITYKWQFNAPDNTGTAYLNRGYQDSDQSNYVRTASYLTVMEIAA